MARFTMNASNIERFSALTTQMQKDLFEVNKNLMYVFGLYGDWKRNKMNECCLHAMVCCWWFRTLSCGNRNPDSNPGFSPFYLFLFLDPIFQRQRNLHNTVFHGKLFYSPQRVYHCTQEIIIIRKWLMVTSLLDGVVYQIVSVT